jgi:hypothetical protein
MAHFRNHQQVLVAPVGSIKFVNGGYLKSALRTGDKTSKDQLAVSVPPQALQLILNSWQTTDQDLTTSNSLLWATDKLQNTNKDKEETANSEDGQEDTENQDDDDSYDDDDDTLLELFDFYVSTKKGEVFVDKLEELCETYANENGFDFEVVEDEDEDEVYWMEGFYIYTESQEEFLTDLEALCSKYAKNNEFDYARTPYEGDGNEEAEA